MNKKVVDVPKVFQEILNAIQDKERVLISDEARKQRSFLVSYHESKLPDIVFLPKTIEEISKVHQICYKNHLPIIPYGKATSLEGHVQPTEGGLILDMKLMNKVIEFNPKDMDVTVEAGISKEALNEYLKPFGMFFPTDPGASNCTLGGMTACRSSGTTTVKYGAMRENVLRLIVVEPSGKVIKTGSRAKKSSAGYDLTRLYVGSEGTLGTICLITLKIYPIPKSIAAAVCPFDTIKSSANTVIEIIQAGIPVTRMELLDEMAITAVNENNGLNYPIQPTLFFEFAGSSDAQVKEQAQQCAVIAKKHNGGDYLWELDEVKRNKLWTARHKAYWATLSLRENSKALTTDVCVPISKLADCIVESKKLFDSKKLIYTTVSHSGDGNWHFIVCVNDNDPVEMKNVHDAYEKMIMLALKADGTCSGEHGIGIGKQEFILHELGVDAIRMMRAIKQAIDPRNIMNPGKLLPSEEKIETFLMKHNKSKL